MPRAVQYNPGSIVYFKGDRSKYVYVLKEGKISLSYEDVHNGQKINELVKLGDFFGILDSLGGYRHDETATTMEPSVVILFGLDEFEEFIQNKPDLLIKMLKIYSRKLRVIHAEVQNLISTQKVIFPEEGMMKVGEYYFKSQSFDQAADIFQRYLKHYPNGAYSAKVEELLTNCKHYSVSKKRETAVQPSVRRNSLNMTSMHQGHGNPYSNGVEAYRNNDFPEAQKFFQQVIQSGKVEHLIEAEFYLGCCYFYNKRYSDTIKQFTGLVRKQPKHPDLGEILYFIGESNGKLENLEKAVAFLKKSLDLLSPGSKMYNSAESSLKDYRKRGGIA